MTNTLDLALRNSLKRAITLSPLSREGIAHELSVRMGRNISVFMLDAWTADTKTAMHLPADCVPALSEILHDDTIQRQLLSVQDLRDLKLGESAVRLSSLLVEKAAEARALDNRPKRPQARRRKL